MLASLYLRKNDVKTARTLLEQVAKSNATMKSQRSRSSVETISTYEEGWLVSKRQETRNDATCDRQLPHRLRTHFAATRSFVYFTEVLRKPEQRNAVAAKLVKISVTEESCLSFRPRLACCDSGREVRRYSHYNVRPEGERRHYCARGRVRPRSSFVTCRADKRAKVDGVLKSVSSSPRNSSFSLRLHGLLRIFTDKPSVIVYLLVSFFSSLSQTSTQIETFGWNYGRASSSLFFFRCLHRAVWAYPAQTREPPVLLTKPNSTAAAVESNQPLAEPFYPTTPVPSARTIARA
jgi:hypothetical protein